MAPQPASQAARPREDSSPAWQQLSEISFHIFTEVQRGPEAAWLFGSDRRGGRSSPSSWLQMRQEWALVVPQPSCRFCHIQASSWSPKSRTEARRAGQRHLCFAGGSHGEQFRVLLPVATGAPAPKSFPKKLPQAASSAPGPAGRRIPLPPSQLPLHGARATTRTAPRATSCGPGPGPSSPPVGGGGPQRAGGTT